MRHTTKDGIRLGAMVELINPPIELQWAKKWIVIYIYNDSLLKIRSTTLKRDIRIARSEAKVFQSCEGFIPMKFEMSPDFAYLPPKKRTHNKIKSTIAINTPNAVEWLKKKMNISLTEFIDNKIDDEIRFNINTMADESALEYVKNTGRRPEYIPVFNSVLSTDINFLRVLKKSYGGEVIEDQMRWVAFKADDL